VIKQISFREPIGSSFHQAVLADQRSTEGLTYEQAATRLLTKGLAFVQARGIISNDERKALAIEKWISNTKPQARTVPVSYDGDETFEKNGKLLKTPRD
jgi:hypothetical protein